MFGGPACAFFKRLSNRIHYHILFSVRDDHDKGKDIEVMSLTTIVVAANALMLARSLWTLGIIARQGKDIFCYFNNDAQGHAVRNALELKQMLEP